MVPSRGHLVAKGGWHQLRRKVENMHVRRTLMAVAACALTSLALVTTAAQAQPTATGTTGSGSATPLKSPFPKIKGAAFYYFCGSNPIVGCPSVYYFVVYGKSKTWEFYGDPGFGGYFVKYKKDPYTYFYYNQGYNEECFLVGLKVKGGYIGGGFWCYDEETGEYIEYETWEAFK